MSIPVLQHDGLASTSLIATPTLLSSLPSAIASIPLELLRAELVRRQAEEEGGGGGQGGGSNGPAGPSTTTTKPASAPLPTKPACGTKGVPAAYSVSSHVFALVLILILSTVACAFPILARRFPKLPIPHHFLFLSRHFGTGVLLATAFVHLLPTAFSSLSDPCLPDFWIKGYPPMPGFIAMISVLVVVGIEMFFASQGAGHIHGSEFDQAPGAGGAHHHHNNRHGGHSVGGGGGGGRRRGSLDEGEEYEFGTVGQKEPRYGRGSRPRGYSEISFEGDEDAREVHRFDDDVGLRELDKLQDAEQEQWGGPLSLSEEGPGKSTSGQNGQAGSRSERYDKSADDEDGDLPLDLDELDPHNPAGDGDDIDLLPSGRSRAEQKETAHRRNQSHRSASSSLGAGAGGSGGSGQIGGSVNPAMAQRLLLQCALLEAGILFHSVFIGMAVSVTRGSAFVVLLIAIAFHQTFEGFALGARISAIVPLLPPGSSRPWLMALAYGTTTPLGQAIGLAIHSLYDPKSEAGLILVGCMNAISSGLLLFAGLVELLAEDFLSESSYKTLRGRRRMEASACVVLGALLMALVGAFA